ncbi:NAD(P)H-binding protein [Saccharopolyspora shandongensis]|uniref:NAD(P)H-binding protein n=1 Tax=Saccharopolyspora shandongensis TaxID=418495 RepID=UPI00341DEF5E
MAILVTGATGTVGRHVVDGLLRARQQVRALTRDPATAALPSEVEVHQGEIGRIDTVHTALAGVDRMYLFPVLDGLDEFIDMAVQAGVRRIVVLSSDSSVNVVLPTNREAGEHHLAVERAVEASGVEWTHLRPGAFAGNAIDWAPSIQAERVVRAPYAAGAQSVIHSADIADVATIALLEDGHAGAKYRLTGPEAITRAEQVRVIAKVLGTDIRFEEITAAQWRDSVRAYLPEVAMDMLLGYWAHAVDNPDPVYPTVTEVTGRPARTFADWAADNVASFR